MSIEQENQPTQISFQDIVDKSLEEANEALKDPFVFKSDIQKVAVIGAGPSGVSKMQMYVCDMVSRY